jgi:ABC-2 type transport system permease protein
VADAVATYRALARAQLRAQWSYRTSFLMEALGTFASAALEILSVLILFRVTPALGGFGFRETLLMSSLALTGFTLADLVAGNLDRLRVYVRTGTLDALLSRPRRVLPQLIFTDVSLRRAGSISSGLAALIWAIALAPVHWTPARLVLLVLTPLWAAAFFVAYFIAGSTVAFFWIESGEFANAFTYGGRTFTTYPVNIYGRTLRALFAYGLGFAFVAYYPALVILGRPDPLGGPAWLGWCTPAVVAVAGTVAWALWRTGLRHYRGAGS